MKVERKAEHAVSDETCKAATGRTLAEWHGLIDDRGGLELGRRKIGDWLAGELKVDPWWSATITHEYELARGAVEKDGKPKGYTICATKSVKADPASCYGAFATAAALDRWFGPRHDAKIEEGGHWRNADGNQATVRKATPRQDDPPHLGGRGAHAADAGRDQVRAERGEDDRDGDDRAAADACRGRRLSAGLGRGAGAVEANARVTCRPIGAPEVRHI